MNFLSNLDIQCKDGWTALMRTCDRNNTELSKILIDNKANLDLQNKYKRTALMLACQVSNVEIVAYMLSWLEE